MELQFDLSEQATRSHILDTLLNAMDEDQRATFDQVMQEVAVPDHHHHGFVEVCQTIENLDVDDAVKESMKGVYELLAAAEAQVHGCSIEETHFHEVGNASGIRNALAICVAFWVLAPTKVVASEVQQGKGKVECAHGLMDIPAPATKAILDSGLPVCEERLEGERCTPTSAAIIKYFVDEFSNTAQAW